MKERWAWRAVLWGVLVAVIGCDHASKISDADVQQIEYEPLRAMLADSQKPVALVDVRSDQKFAEGNIPGAINIHFPALAAGDDRLVAAESIVVYGAGWSDDLAIASAKRLLVLGYERVYVFRGGLELWNSGGKSPHPAEQ